MIEKTYVTVYFAEGGLISLSDGVRKNIRVLTSKSEQHSDYDLEL